MALFATCSLVGALQRERRSLVMIEQRRLPLRAVVARYAIGYTVLGKLFSMDILVALLALGRRGLEINVGQLGFHVRRPVAIRAGSGPMRTDQREIGFRVIEARQLLPRFRGVAGFAARAFAVHSGAEHTLPELPFVWIGMTGRAIKFLPMIDSGLLIAGVNQVFVTVGADGRDMAARQYETSLLVTHQGKCRGMISVESMAFLTLIEVRRCRKLGCVPIRVTVRTELELDLVEGVLAPRNMTLRAFQASVPALQRIGARRMFFDPEPGGLESVNGVARRAFAAIGALGELAVVRIRLVAIRALIEGNGLLEITLSVALHAFDLGMLSQQRILGFRVIETIVECGRGDLLPPGRRVARLAGLLEAAVVNISVAIRALAKGNSRVSRLAAGPGRVALLAGDLGVQSSQGIASLGMIKLLDRGN